MDALSLLDRMLIATFPPVRTPAEARTDSLLRHLDYPSRARAEILEHLAAGGSATACEAVEPWHAEAVDVVWRGLEVECHSTCEACASDALERQGLLETR